MTADVTTRALMAQLNQTLGARDRIGANGIVAQLIAAQAALGVQWRALAQLCEHNGALDLARRAMRLHVGQARGDLGARLDEAALLARLGDLDAAETELRAMPPGFPDPATRAHFLGTLALNRGDLANARTRFAEALAARPASGASWLALVDASRALPASEWAPAVIDAGRTMAGASAADRAAYAYAAGAAHDALGDVDAAFAAFDAGAVLIRPTRPYDAAADRAAVQQAMLPAVIDARPRIATGRPIFVFGTPRSGTTLVEQILASHSAVADGGEVQLFDLVAERIGGLSGAAMAGAAASPGLDALAEDYLSLAAERFGPTGRIVDKSLTSQRYLALIPAVLPDAPLVWVRRDPLATAWSCFRTLFVTGVAWSFDQVTIAHHMRLDEQLLAFWRGRLGSRLLVVDYQALVTDKETAIARLLDHCGLPFEPAVLEPHRTARSVVTASVSQVRAPISDRAIGAATPYRRHLRPFIEAYRAAGGTID